MKKIIAVLAITCFSFTLTAMSPKPAIAADDNVPVIIGVSVVVGLGAVLGLIFAGQAAEQDVYKNDFDPKLGKWTYEQMLAEKGEPSAVTDGTNVILAEYYNSEVVSKGNTVYHKGNFLSEASSETTTKQGKLYYGTKISLYFDKNTKILKGWDCEGMSSDGSYVRWLARGGDRSFVPLAASAKASVTAAAVPAGEKTLEQKLNDLNGLKDKKLITDEEYSTARKKLLDNAVK
jgi:hypothetical protein